jgi:hypothetical protein
MKIDTLEIAALSQATDQPARRPVRRDPQGLARHDGRQPAGRGPHGQHRRHRMRRNASRVGALLDFCSLAPGAREPVGAPAIEARAPGASARIAHEHDDHEQHIATLRATLLALTRPARRAAPRRQSAAGPVPPAGPVRRRQPGAHGWEETTHNALLWARYTDAELLAIHAALVGSIPPEEMAFALRWMLPAMNPQERCAMLADMRDNAPAEAFAGHTGHRPPAARCTGLGPPGAWPGAAAGSRAGRRPEARARFRALRPAPAAAAPAGGSGPGRSSRCARRGRVRPGGVAAAAGAPPGCR